MFLGIEPPKAVWQVGGQGSDVPVRVRVRGVSLRGVPIRVDPRVRIRVGWSWLWG